MKVQNERKLRIFIPIILYMSMIIDSALPAIFPSQFLGSEQKIVPHILLYMIVLFAFYFKDGKILLYSFLAGLIVDSYTTTVIGLYAFAYVTIAFIIHKIKRYFPKKFIIHFMLMSLAICLVDFVIFVFWKETQMINVTLTIFVARHLVPTLIFNTVISLLLYFPSKTLLSWLGYEEYIIF